MVSQIAKIWGVPYVLRKTATGPPFLKGRMTKRIASALASRVYPGMLRPIQTNLGISSRLKVAIPSYRHDALFGRPRLDIGERATIDLAVFCSRHSDVFVDVGANLGLYTFLIADLWGPERHKDIHLFEPDPRLHGRLKENFESNGMAVHLNCVAVSDRIGRQIFNVNLDSDVSGSLTDFFKDQHRTVPIDVDVVTLSDYFARHDIRKACVKIDVEGAGVAVWEGARAIIDRVRWLLIETIEIEEKARLVERIGVESGWHGYYIRDYTLIHVSARPTYVAPFLNWFFCRHPPEELAAKLRDTRFVVEYSQSV